MSASEAHLFIHTGDDIEKLTGVDDVAETTTNRLQLARADDAIEAREGWLFGGRGIWVIWVQNGRAGVSKHVVSKVLSMPGGGLRLTSYPDGRTVDTGGRIRRMKRVGI